MPADPYVGLLEPVLETFDVRLKQMFGGFAYYVDDRLVWLNTARRKPWDGVLVPTERQHHAGLRRAVPALRPHPVLGKWLYLPASHREFEASALRLATLIAEGDGRVGVAPSRRLTTSRRRGVGRTKGARE